MAALSVDHRTLCKLKLEFLREDQDDRGVLSVDQFRRIFRKVVYKWDIQTEKLLFDYLIAEARPGVVAYSALLRLLDHSLVGVANASGEQSVAARAHKNQSENIYSLFASEAN